MNKSSFRGGVAFLFRVFAIFFAASMALNLFLFLLNVSFGWHLPAIAVKPYIPGFSSGYGRIDLDNIQDFLLFEFMFGVAFVISFVIGWWHYLLNKIKQYPKVAALCGVIMMILLFYLARFLTGDIQASRLYAAIEKGDVVKVEKILQSYTPPKERSQYYFFIIDDAYPERLAAMVRILVQHGFDINAKHPDAGATSFMFQMHFNTPSESIDAMLDHGASPEITDNEGQNALHYALTNIYIPKDTQSSDYQNLLINLKHALDKVPGREKQLINHEDNQGKTPLMIAQEKNLKEVVALFSSYK